MTTGVHYAKPDSYAPVPSWTTIKLQLALTSKHKMQLRAFDCTAAYLQADLKDPLYWSLQGEDQQAKRWPASLVTKWLNRLLPLVKCSPPAGEKWTGHSLRSGGACASLAIGVGFFHIQQYGVWKSITSVQRYLSLFTLASRAAYIFFGWMLPAPPPPA